MDRMTGKDIESMDDEEFWDFVIQVVNKYGQVGVYVTQNPEPEMVLQILLGIPLEWGEVMETMLYRLEEITNFNVNYTDY